MNTFELAAIDSQAAGRGDRNRRLRTVPTALDLEVGPFRIVGLAHSRPGVDVLTTMADRKLFLPVTLATMVFLHAGKAIERDAHTLLVNRHLVSSVHRRVEVLPPDLDIPRPTDVRAEDMTGYFIS